MVWPNAPNTSCCQQSVRRHVQLRAQEGKMSNYVQRLLTLVLCTAFLAGMASYTVSAHTSTSVIPEACKNGATVKDGVVQVTGNRYHCATGVNNTVRFSIKVPAGHQGVIATYGADCVEGGIFLGLDEGTSIDIEVTDGMVQVATPNNAARIFREQVDKSLQMDEAVGYVQPLDSWGFAPMLNGDAVQSVDIVKDLLNKCGSDGGPISHLSTEKGCLYGCDLNGDGKADDMVNDSTPSDSGNDQQTGDNVTPTPGNGNGTGGSTDTVDGIARCDATCGGDPQSFKQGDAVYGETIDLNSDSVNDCQGGNCYYSSAPSDGTVYGGVVHPWNAEVANLNDLSK